MTLPKFSLGTLRQGKLREMLDRDAGMLLRAATRMHREAPRSGRNINKFGEPRSAPGEPPAPETRTLLRLMVIEQPAFLERDVTVNYTIMETGTRLMEPRPLGLQALAIVRSDLKGR